LIFGQKYLLLVKNEVKKYSGDKSDGLLVTMGQKAWDLSKAEYQ